MVFQAVDLVGVHLFANLQEHVGVDFLELGAGLGDAVDLGEEGRFVGLRRCGERCHPRLDLLEGLEASRESRSILLKDRVHARLLVGTELEASGEAVVIPPAAGRAELEAGSSLCARRGWTSLGAGTAVWRLRSAHAHASGRRTAGVATLGSGDHRAGEAERGHEGE